MSILKGALLSICLFGFGTMGFLYLRLHRYMEPHSSLDVRIIGSLTTGNPLWWTALVVCLVLGIAIAHSWSA